MTDFQHPFVFPEWEGCQIFHAVLRDIGRTSGREPSGSRMFGSSTFTVADETSGESDRREPPENRMFDCCSNTFTAAFEKNKR